MFKRLSSRRLTRRDELLAQLDAVKAQYYALVDATFTGCTHEDERHARALLAQWDELDAQLNEL